MKPKVLLIGCGSYGEFIKKSSQDLSIELEIIDGHLFGQKYLNQHRANYVIIATPNYTHFNLVRMCLDAGKHVLCEKPLALNLVELNLLYATAKKSNLHLGVGFVLHRHPHYQWLKRQSHKWGGVAQMRVYNHATEGLLTPKWYWNKKQSGGWFMVAEIHWYHLFAWLTDATNLSITHANEIKSKQRTIATISHVQLPRKQVLQVEHRLDMDYNTAWTKVEITFFDGTRAVIDDWVPRAVNISDGITKVDHRSRDAIYAELINANIRAMLNHAPIDASSVFLAHKIALQAQEMSGIRR